MPVLPEIYDDKVDLALRDGLIPAEVLELVQRALDAAPPSELPEGVIESRIGRFERP